MGGTWPRDLAQDPKFHRKKLAATIVDLTILPRQGEVAPSGDGGGGHATGVIVTAPSDWQVPATYPLRGRIEEFAAYYPIP